MAFMSAWRCYITSSRERYTLATGDFYACPRAPPEVEDRLTAAAEAAGQTATSFASDAIIEFLNDLEDVRIAESRLAANRAGLSGSVPLEEVMKRYGMEG